MASVQIRHVPPDVHEALVRRADAAGQSLQQYLIAQLRHIAETPTVDEVLDRIEASVTAHLPVSSTLQALDDDRARR